ncbi:MarR family transcriptional regulator [Couchioplanes caeruleus]|uniref:HTH marR-type domain-containing protein n=1 Tax=Couchioplanes caeruleus subsp. caeruleus TaxID=56427 RepID=A0A1K0GRC9_9ACTN|nr:helix-turn-helix domain-containing protein [Couchioplanes caeruleus]OJF13748.1 hypothetical protein BG844_13505 [Couchioplanes caeruleus subsp. caeruleus]
MIAGVPAPQLRTLLQHIKRRDGLTVAEIADLLEVDADASRSIIDHLLADGHLTQIRDPGGHELFDTTISGNAIAGAKFVSPIPAAKAEQVLAAFLNRVRAYNADPDNLLTVERVTLFGSHACGAAEVADVDVSITVVRRVTGDAYADATEALGARVGARREGVLDHLRLPQRLLHSTLKNRNRYLSITNEDVSQFTDDYRTVYRHADDPDAQPFPPGAQIDHPGTPDRADS